MDGCDSSTGVFHTPVSTDDGDVCTTDVCDSSTGSISHTPTNTDDGNACTLDGCDSSTGVFHTPVSTDDGDACTTDACDSSTGSITHTPTNTDDGNACTDDGCDSSTGIFHTPVSTDDGDACTTDGCNSASVNNDLLSTNDFNFSGALAANGWIAHSGSGTNPFSTTSGLTYAGFPGSGIANAALVNNLNGEDDNITFTNQNTNGQSIYYSCLVNVTESAATKTGEYFLHIGTPGGATFTSFAARVFARVTVSGVNFGLSNTSTATYGTTNFAKNTTYLLIVKYTIVTGAGFDPTSLWIIPSGVPVSELTAGTPEVINISTNGVDAVNTIALRQAANTPQTVVDGIRVGKTWTSVVTVPVASGVFHTPVNTDDGNVCTVDGCDSSIGIFHNAASTDDGNACTTDGCDSSTGVFHTPVSTDDGDVCTMDACDSSTGSISHTPTNSDDGIACTLDGCNSITGIFHTPVNCGTVLSSNIQLEGFYLGGGTMTPEMFNVGVSPNPLVVDVVTISAMDAAYPNGPNGINPVDAQTDTLYTDGSISITFGPVVLQGSSYYLKVNHRNSLEIWTPAAIVLGASTTYLFSTAVTQALNSSQILSGDGVALVYQGDLNQDLSIDASDFLVLDPEIQAGLFGYFLGDLTGEGSVDASDFLALDPNIQAGVTGGTP